MTGRAYLVGSGPGDPGLLTLKAARVLAEADVVIYDYLANPRHLALANPQAEKIPVGKAFRHKKLSQEKINRLIIRAAKNGKSVVRLKGGDPYLFGRGGEEALFLKKHRIPFEVVPGVTSATACAAYAGVPLTHRKHNASVTFLTGHRADDKQLDSIAWEKIAGIGGTLVIYMGLYNLPKIAKHLVKNGLSARTPACVIEWGTLPRQRSCEGTLADIASKAKRLKFVPPSLVIVGEVVTLRRHLGWFEGLPLFGRRVAVTRGGGEAEKLSRRLGEEGAEVIECPTIETEIEPASGALREAAERLHEHDWVVFTSAKAVFALFFQLACLGKDARAFGRCRVACVGPATFDELSGHGVSADILPERHDAESLLQAFRSQARVKSKRVLLPLADIAPDKLEEGLEAMGAFVRRVTAYKTIRPKSLPLAAKRAMRKGEVDFITFTSASTAENFAALFGAAQARRLSRRAKFISIGPSTTAAMRRLGFRVARQAKEATLEAVAEAVKREAGK